MAGKKLNFKATYLEILQQKLYHRSVNIFENVLILYG